MKLNANSDWVKLQFPITDRGFYLVSSTYLSGKTEIFIGNTIPLETDVGIQLDTKKIIKVPSSENVYVRNLYDTSYVVYFYID